MQNAREQLGHLRAIYEGPVDPMRRGALRIEIEALEHEIAWKSATAAALLEACGPENAQEARAVFSKIAAGPELDATGAMLALRAGLLTAGLIAPDVAGGIVCQLTQSDGEMGRAAEERQEKSLTAHAITAFCESFDDPRDGRAALAVYNRLGPAPRSWYKLDGWVAEMRRERRPSDPEHNLVEGPPPSLKAIGQRRADEIARAKAKQSAIFRGQPWDNKMLPQRGTR